MGRTAVSERSKSKKNEQIAQIAARAAKKAVKKTVEKEARKVSTRVAAKVAQETSLNPDYDPSEDLELDEDEESGAVFGAFGGEDDEEEESVGGFGFDEEEEEEEEEDTSDLTYSPRQKDIFSFADEKIKAGVPIRFQIKKNGHFVATIRTPYSEEKLQKDHGEGHYQIVLRDDIKGTFLKQQSMSVAAPSAPRPEEVAKVEQQKQQQEDVRFEKMFSTFSTMSQQTQESTNLMIERLMEENRIREEQDRERRKEERELMKEAEKGNMNVLATVLQAALAPKNDGGMNGILQMMQQQSQQTMTLIMESNKNFATMMQDMRRDTDRMLEKITTMTQEQARDFRQQLHEMSNKKNDNEFDAVKMFEMLNKTRQDGLDFGLKLQTMAKELADEGAGEQRPRGVVESVLDNLGKIAPLMFAAGQGGGGAAQHFAPPTPQPARQALPAAPAQPSYRKETPRPAQSANPTTVRPAPARPVESKSTVTPATPAKQVVATPKPAASGVKTGAKKTTTQTSVASSPETGKIGNDLELKKKVVDTCVPLIAHALQNQFTSGNLGDATINAFSATGIDLKSALTVLTVDEIYDIAFRQYSLPDVPELRNYLKDYHDYLSQKATSPESR